MKRAGNTSNRPEQMLAKKILERRHPWYRILTEYIVTDIKPAGGVDLTGPRAPRLDIVMLIEHRKKIGIRMQGEYHDEKKQERKDFIQKQVLEHPVNGWKIYDFVYSEMPNLWALKEEQAESETINQMF